jgi:hypothetical protein
MPAPSEGPGPVAWAHRLTIATAFLGTLAYAAWEFADGGAGSTARGTLALGVAAGFGWYLRRLRTRLIAKLTPRHEP